MREDSIKDNFGTAEITKSNTAIKTHMQTIAAQTGMALEIQPKWPYWVLLYYAYWHSDLKLTQREKDELFVWLIFMKNLNPQWEDLLCKVQHNLSKRNSTIIKNAQSYLMENPIWL